MMLKKRKEYYSGTMPDSNYNFGNDYSGSGDEEDEEDDDDYGDDDYGDDRDEDIYVPLPRIKRGTGRVKKGKSPSYDDSEASCLGCGCLVLFVIGIFIVLRLYSGVPFSQW